MKSSRQTPTGAPGAKATKTPGAARVTRPQPLSLIEAAASARAVAGQYIEAAELVMERLGLDRAKKGEIDPANLALARTAAGYFVKGHEVQRAASVYVAIGEPDRAIDVLTEAGEVEAANGLRVDLTSPSRMTNRRRDAAFIASNGAIGPVDPLLDPNKLESEGLLELALRAYAESGQHADAGRLALRLGQQEEAAAHFAAGGMRYEAAQCHLAAGQAEQSLGQFVQISRDHECYREACVQAIRVANEIDQVTFHLDHFLRRFLSDQPRNPDEIEALGALGNLYLAHDYPENAREVFRLLTLQSRATPRPKETDLPVPEAQSAEEATESKATPKPTDTSTPRSRPGASAPAAQGARSRSFYRISRGAKRPKGTPQSASAEPEPAPETAAHKPKTAPETAPPTPEPPPEAVAQMAEAAPEAPPQKPKGAAHKPNAAPDPDPIPEAPSPAPAAKERSSRAIWTSDEVESNDGDPHEAADPPSPKPMSGVIEPVKPRDEEHGAAGWDWLEDGDDSQDETSAFDRPGAASVDIPGLGAGRNPYPDDSSETMSDTSDHTWDLGGLIAPLDDQPPLAPSFPDDDGEEEEDSMASYDDMYDPLGLEDPFTPPPGMPDPTSDVQPPVPVGIEPTPDNGADSLVSGLDDYRAVEIGTTLANRYRIEEQIGQGGMASVFRASDLVLSETIALKIFHQSIKSDVLLARFRLELKHARQLTHTNIIRLYDFGIAGPLRYISMEYLEGQDLYDIMGRPACEEHSRPLPIDQGIDYLMQTAAGLQAAHDMSVIHRDVKPDNIFVTQDGVVKLMDFGIAKKQHTQGVTVYGLSAGTPEYMAPEQLRQFSDVTFATDIYSLGVVGYQIFAGILPFHHKELLPLLMMHASDTPVLPSKRNPKIPTELDEVLLKMLAKSPDDRFSSCKALNEALDGVRKSL